MRTNPRISKTLRSTLAAVCAAMLLTATPLTTAQTQDHETILRDGVPETYVVVQGDTLWGIAARFLKDPWMWPRIWEANPDIENPHLIFPGDIIRLVWVDGQPRLRVERGAPPAPARATDRLSPQVRVLPLDDAIPSIPLEVIRPFLSRPLVISENELDDRPYLLRAVDGRLMSGEGHRVYARGLGPDPELTWTIVRRGQAYRDPGTNEVLGFEAEYIAEARVDRLGDPATVTLTASRQEALAGDRLIPMTGQPFDSSLEPRAPRMEVEGQIVARLGGGLQIGQYHVVVVNRGVAHGLEPGMVLSIWQKGEEITDMVGPRGGRVQLPDERAGEIIIFRTAERVSFGLVMRAARDMSAGDFVRNP